MTIEEGKKAIAELKSEGNTEEEILFGFYRMFQEDEIDINVLEALTHLVGYELTDEFKNMSPEDQKTKGYEEKEDTEGQEEKIEERDEANERANDEHDIVTGDEREKDDKESEESEEPEEDERKKAMKLFGLNKEDK